MEIPKVTIRKYEGDDSYSWAVFRSDQKEPVVSGLTKPGASWYAQCAEIEIKKEFPFFIRRQNTNGSFVILNRYKTFDEALEKLKKVKSHLRHEVWNYLWPMHETDSKPLAWIN